MDDAGGDGPRLWIGVIGDRIEGFEPHDTIAGSIDHAAAQLGVAAPDVRWIATDELARHGASHQLAGAAGVWCAPGSPYRSLEGALDGIRWVREHDVAFLGTCAGFQHGVIEFARHVLGHTGAAHREYDALETTSGSPPAASAAAASAPTDPAPINAAATDPASTPDAEYFIDELLCSLAGQTMQVELLDPELCELYGTAHPVERYYCRFGLNPRWREPLQRAGLRVAGIDRRDGDVRLLRLAGHPCYLLTLFVPQTSSRPERPHPLIVHYLRAAGAAAHASADPARGPQAK